MKRGISVTYYTRDYRDRRVFMEYVDVVDHSSGLVFHEVNFPKFGFCPLYIPLDEAKKIEPIEPDFIDIGPSIHPLHVETIKGASQKMNATKVAISSDKFIELHMKDGAAGHVPVSGHISRYRPAIDANIRRSAIELNSGDIHSKIVHASSSVFHLRARKFGDFRAFPPLDVTASSIVRSLLKCIVSGADSESVLMSPISNTEKTTFSDYFSTYPVTPKIFLSCLCEMYIKDKKHDWTSLPLVNAGTVMEESTFVDNFGFSAMFSVFVHDAARRAVKGLISVISTMLARNMFAKDVTEELRLSSMRCAFMLTVYLALPKVMEVNGDNAQFVTCVRNIHLVNLNDPKLATPVVVDHTIRTCVAMSISYNYEKLPILKLFYQVMAADRLKSTKSGAKFELTHRDYISEVFTNLSNRNMEKLIEIMSTQKPIFADIVLTQRQAYTDYISDFGLDSVPELQFFHMNSDDLFALTMHGPNHAREMASEINTILGMSRPTAIGIKFGKPSIMYRYTRRVASIFNADHEKRLMPIIVDIHDTSKTKRGEFRNHKIAAMIYTGITPVINMIKSDFPNERLYMGWIWTPTHALMVKMGPVWIDFRAVHEINVKLIDKEEMGAFSCIEMELTVPLSDPNAGELLAGKYTPILGNHVIGWFRGRTREIVIHRICMRTDREYTVDRNTPISAAWTDHETGFEYVGFHSAHSMKPYADTREKLRQDVRNRCPLTSSMIDDPLRHIIRLGAGGDGAFGPGYASHNEKSIVDDPIQPATDAIRIDSLWRSVVDWIAVTKTLIDLSDDMKQYNIHALVKQRAMDEYLRHIAKITEAKFGYFTVIPVTDDKLPEVFTDMFNLFKMRMSADTIIPTLQTRIESSHPNMGTREQWINVFLLAAGVASTNLTGYNKYVNEIKDGEDNEFMNMMMAAYETISRGGLLTKASEIVDDVKKCMDLFRILLLDPTNQNLIDFARFFQSMHDKCYYNPGVEKYVTSLDRVYADLEMALKNLKSTLQKYSDLKKMFNSLDDDYKLRRFNDTTAKHLSGEMNTHIIDIIAFMTQYEYAYKHLTAEDRLDTPKYTKSMDILLEMHPRDKKVKGYEDVINHANYENSMTSGTMKYNGIVDVWTSYLDRISVEFTKTYKSLPKGVDLMEVLLYSKKFRERCKTMPEENSLRFATFYFADMNLASSTLLYIHEYLKYTENNGIEFYTYPYAVEFDDFRN